MKVVDQNIRSFTRTYGAKSVASGVIQRITERAAQTEPLPTLPATSPTPAPSAPQASATAPVPAAPRSTETAAAAEAEAPPSPDSVAILTECLIQLAEFTAATAIDLPAMESVCLGALRRALLLQDCVLFQRNPGGQTYTAQSGLGDLLSQVRGRPVISTERRDVFSICLSRREDVLIRDTSDPKIRPFLPEWLLAAGVINGFILLPLLNETGPVGLIIGTRSGPRQLQPSARELQLLKAIRQHLVAARRLAGVKD
jgi:hypothetical protein